MNKLGGNKSHYAERDTGRGMCLSLGYGWNEAQKRILTTNKHSHGSEKGIHSTATG